MSLLKPYTLSFVFSLSLSVITLYMERGEGKLLLLKIVDGKALEVWDDPNWQYAVTRVRPASKYPDKSRVDDGTYMETATFYDMGDTPEKVRELFKWTREKREI